MTDGASRTAQTNGTDAPAGGQWRTAAARSITQVLNDQLTRVKVSPGHRVLDLTGVADRKHLSRLVGPSGHIDAPDRAQMPEDPRGYDIVLADRQPDRVDALAPMTALLRSGGWLILAGTAVTPPVVYTAVPGSTSVIDRVVRAINALTPSPAPPPSADTTIGVLIELGMDQVCVTTHTETSRGGGPECALYSHAARHLHDRLTGNAGFTTAELGQFDQLMQDPGILLRLSSTVALHARMSTA
ncbi:hypothetical protein [Micromonospora profundi]|uniref:hypothetical protein n=1 Tax=Micromonospora profundi TaxID=1420889 RepID=UPI003663A88D